MNALPKVVLNELFLVLLLLPGTNGVSEAATIMADGARCSLVDAITAANSNVATNGCPAGDDGSEGGDVIDLRTDVLLTEVNNTDADGCGNGLPAVIGTLTIQGNGHTIARSIAEGTPEFRLFDSKAGDLTLRRSTVTGGGFGYFLAQICKGGAIYGNVVLWESTIFRNRGAGIAGMSGVINSTVSGNEGGGIYGPTSLVNSTVTGNWLSGCGGGGGVRGPVRMSNSIVAENTFNCHYHGGVPGDLGDCESVIFDGINLIGDGRCHAAERGQLTAGPWTYPEKFPYAGLGPLADNGGPALTHALLPGSPAIDAGDDAVCAADPVNGVDQRGVQRPKGLHCDLGAFELSTADSDNAAPALIQSRWPGKAIGSFEVVVREGEQLCHYYRSNVTAGYPWAKTACFGDGITTAPALIQSTFGNPGNFEVVVGESNQLCHYYRNNSAPGYPWSKTQCFGDNITSKPALIQSRWPGKAIGSFEVVVREGEQLCHYYRSNVTASSPWSKTACFGDGVESAPALIQSSFGNPGNFEVVVKEGDQLCHYYRNNSARGYPWSKTQCFSGPVDSAPAVLQSRWPGKAIGSFEVVVREQYQLCHYYRSNISAGYPWAKTACFGDGITTAPALIQSTIGNPGNFDVVVGRTTEDRTQGLQHYSRANSASGYPWYGASLFGVADN